MLSYRVMRVPNQTSLVPLYGTDGTTRRNYDTGNEQAANYFDVASVQASENSISFYVPENIKQARQTCGTTYANRDLREKDAAATLCSNMHRATAPMWCCTDCMKARETPRKP